MTIDQELRLSYYQQVADINTDHCIYWVQDVRAKKLYVKKLLTVYKADIYRYLMAHHIPNTPTIYLVEEDDNILTVSKVIKKCVELSPTGRYQSIADLQSSLDQLSWKDKASTGKKNWKNYLLPGFRNSNVIKWLFSALGYAALLSIGLDLQIENAGSVELLINRIAFIFMELCIIFFNGNYLNVQRFFVLTKNPKKWVRWLGMAVSKFASDFINSSVISAALFLSQKAEGRLGIVTGFNPYRSTKGLYRSLITFA